MSSSGTRLLYSIVSWTGVISFLLGSVVTMWSLVTFVQVRTGWGLTEIERCCLQLGKASLGGVLSGMFFVLIGAAVILLLHPIRAHRARNAGRGPARWLRWFGAVMAVYGVGVVSFATFLAGIAEELEGFAVGIVTYCMLVGVGMLAAAWGFRRAGQIG